MTLQEAIKLNQPFRRQSWTHSGWLCVRHLGGYMGGELWWTGDENDRATLFYTDDLLAEDWESRAQTKQEKWR